MIMMALLAMVALLVIMGSAFVDAAGQFQHHTDGDQG